MAELVVMPKLGLLMENGMVSTWRVAEGDPVAVGDIIAEITTEKITYELESQYAGTMLKIVLPEDEEAPVGAPIGLIGEPGEDLSGLLSAPSIAGRGTLGVASQNQDATADMAADAWRAKEAAAAAPSGARILASPAAKKRAAELGLDLAGLTGTGPGARITLEDVMAAAASAAAASPLSSPLSGGMPAPANCPPGAGFLATPVARRLAAELGVDLACVQGTGIGGRVTAGDVSALAGPAQAGAPGARLSGPPVSAAGTPDLRGGVAEQIPYAGMRRLIGEHMDASRKLAPTVTYTAVADVQRLKELLAWANAARPGTDKLSITPVVIKAVALTLRRLPRFNASLEGEVIKVWGDVNVGIAVALSDGLIVPVVRRADERSIVEIASRVRDLATRARENKLLPDEISGGTFTVTTLGPYRSVDFFNPIINQPEAAILGVGRMKDAVAVADGQPQVRATLGLSLTCDHRVVDGAPAAEFLRTLMDYLADPLTIAPWPA
jgi:pyruvate dehydrogenase E2 component (dihydrolipoamide acetyltransferase)